MSSPGLFRVGLILTERCSVRCGHCWFSCGPDREATMTRGQAEDIIDQAWSLGARWVSFTGGEPFLEYNLLLSLVEYASGKGLYTEAVTNCSWAEDRMQAMDKLQPVAGAGLTAINMSVDDFHQEHIPLDRVRHCFEEAKTLNIKPVFMVAVKPGSRITAESLPRLMGDPSIQVPDEPRMRSPSALAAETPFTPVGRGEKLEWTHAAVAQSYRCESVLTDIGVKPDGDVLPCCGPLGCRGDAVIGNLSEDTLRDVLSRAWGDPRFKKIREGFESGAAFAGRCHACYMLFGEDY